MVLVSSHFLLCCVCWLSPGSPFFSNERQKGSGSGWEGRCGKNWEEEREGTILKICEGRIDFQKKGEKEKERN